MKTTSIKRTVNGVLLLDKPSGFSSNAALQQIKRSFSARKAGHTGSLDPLASGMLPICLGEASKFSQILLDADKKYLVTMRLGQKTTTGDAEGEIIASQPVPTLNAAEFTAILQEFTGEIQQVPPMYSALKMNGQPLYRLARQGIEVERKSRNITIYSLKLLDLSTDAVTLEVHCSKGTYIRTLVEDIGTFLGCGAHVIFLRRIAVATFTQEQMVSLEELTALATDYVRLDQYLLPVDAMLMAWPELVLSDSSALRLCHGQTVIVNSPNNTGLVRIKHENGQFLGVGEIVNAKLIPLRLINSHTNA